MVIKHLKKSSTTPTGPGSAAYIKMRYYYTSSRFGKAFENLTVPRIGKDVGKWGSFPLLEGMEMGTSLRSHQQHLISKL